MTLDFQIDNQIITRKDNKRVVADSQNYLYASFLFSEDWEGISKTAIFRNEDNTPYEMLLDETDTCLVPAEVLDAGEVSVSVFGGDLITVNKVYIEVEESGLIDGQTPQPPTPNIYNQILEVAQSAEQTAQSVEDRADAGEFDGKDAVNVRTIFEPTKQDYSIWEFSADTIYDVNGTFRLVLPDSQGTMRKRLEVKQGSILFAGSLNQGAQKYNGALFPYVS